MQDMTLTGFVTVSLFAERISVLFYSEYLRY